MPDAEATLARAAKSSCATNWPKTAPNLLKTAIRSQSNFLTFNPSIHLSFNIKISTVFIIPLTVCV